MMYLGMYLGESIKILEPYLYLKLAGALPLGKSAFLSSREYVQGAKHFLRATPDI